MAAPVRSLRGSGRPPSAAGAGAQPFYLSGQPVSLTGPYKGAPYGLAIAVHAVAGPFDLGTVVVRQALKVDPDDAHVTVVSDPIPTIRDGVPFRLRRIHVDGQPARVHPVADLVSAEDDRCERASPPAARRRTSRRRFRPAAAASCGSRRRCRSSSRAPRRPRSEAIPAFEALVTQTPGESGFKALTVTLPLSLALDPNNAESDSLCEYADGLKNQCPAKSVIGTMTAISPLLKAPLSGKVYFVKGVRTDPKSGRQIRTLPTLLIELRGEVNVNLRATNSVPDNQHLTTTFP